MRAFKKNLHFVVNNLIFHQVMRNYAIIYHKLIFNRTTLRSIGRNFPDKIINYSQLLMCALIINWHIDAHGIARKILHTNFEGIAASRFFSCCWTFPNDFFFGISREKSIIVLNGCIRDWLATKISRPILKLN